MPTSTAPPGPWQSPRTHLSNPASAAQGPPCPIAPDYDRSHAAAPRSTSLPEIPPPERCLQVPVLSSAWKESLAGCVSPISSLVRPLLLTRRSCSSYCSTTRGPSLLCLTATPTAPPISSPLLITRQGPVSPYSFQTVLSIHHTHSSSLHHRTIGQPVGRDHTVSSDLSRTSPLNLVLTLSRGRPRLVLFFHPFFTGFRISRHSLDGPPPARADRPLLLTASDIPEILKQETIFCSFLISLPTSVADF